MALSEEFKEAVEQDKKTRVRIMLKDSLLVDSSCAEFDEMFKFAQTAMPDLMDSHDGESFKALEQWNEDYLNDQMVAVVNNFSKERIDLLKKMVKKLYSEPAKASTPKEKPIQNIAYSNTSKNSSNSSDVLVGGIVSGVGAAVLIGGLAADAPVVVPILGGAAIGVGAFMILKNKL